MIKILNNNNNNDDDLKFIYIQIMSKFGGASKDFLVDLTYKDFWFENYRIELI